jgi:acyl transferase domain-containing protein/NAD(P)-dependent dehydrogenase (short-subunit alcohol dehydrogenase family)/acyl carrier protein
MTSTEQQLRGLLTRSVREVERLRDQLAKAERPLAEPIAIVGVGLRMPGGVEDLESLWTLLEDQRDVVRTIPRERWDAERDFDPNPEAPGKSYVREAAFADDVDRFDAAFFGISPREAKRMDPQHRLLLEASWHALEHAGVLPSSLARSRTGVFVGIGPCEYSQLGSIETADAYVPLGTHASFAAGRIAFHLGLQGPAMSVDTACSSSLVALHLATRALRSGECELAIAAGVSVMAAPDSFVHLSNTRAVAPDGRCKSFSANADGYGRGEGVVVLVLAPLSAARARNLEVLALVRGSAVNHDGASNGITAPNGRSQQQVIRAALDDAGLLPADIDVVECHGTGTELGDPIEVQALAAAYAQGRTPERPLQIGTIKTNVGHLESAAGLAGVAKILAAMGRRSLPATLRCTPPNPLIDWDALAVEVVDSQRPWLRRDADTPRRAGVSGFGLSGTNAHIILEEPAPHPELAPTRTATTDAVLPLLLSARSEAGLRTQAARLRAHLDAHPELELRDVGYSLATQRTQFEHRACVLGDVRLGLDDLASNGLGARVVTGTLGKSNPALAFSFTGQGAQHIGMGRQLYQQHPVFRSTFDACAAQFDAVLERPLREVVFIESAGTGRGGDSPEAKLLDRTDFTQGALFALELALARLLESWGVRPDVVFGHSIGELVAACVAGVFSLEDACKLVAARGRLMQSLPEGGVMIAIEASESELAELLASHPGAELAAINGPRSLVVSGEAQPVLDVAAHFQALGRRTKRLQVSHAFHSQRMAPMLDAFAKVARSIEYRRPQIPIAANVHGELADPEQLCDPNYWVRQICAPVRFHGCVSAVERLGVRVIIELGPQGVLTPMAAECLSAAARDHVALVPSLRRDRGESETLIAALGTLHCLGGIVDWPAMFVPHEPQRVSLPGYAFVRERHWLDAEPTPTRALVRPSSGRYALAGQRVDLRGGSCLHTLDIGPQIQPYLEHHAVYGRLVVPGSFYLALLVAVAESHWPDRAIELRDVEFIRAIAFDHRNDARQLHVELEPRAGVAGFAAELFTIVDGQRVEHCRAKLAPLDEPEHVSAPLALPGNASSSDMSGLAQLLERVDIEWGPRWWWLESAERIDEHAVLGRFQPAAGVVTDDAPLPCALIDNSFGLQSFADHFFADPNDSTPRLPFCVERMVWYGERTHASLAALTLVEQATDASICDIVYADRHGRPLAHIEGFTTRRAPRERLLRASVGADLYRVEWRPAALPSTNTVARLAIIGSELAGHVDVAALLAAIDAGEPLPDVVVLARLDPIASPTLAAEQLQADLQTWLRDARLADTRLAILTRHAIEVRPGEGVADLHHAPTWGMARALMAEHPERRITLVDIDHAEPSLVELSRVLTSDEPQLALREGECLLPQLARVPSTTDRLQPGWHRNHTVLITGGTGELGSRLAQHLVDMHGVQRLVLLSRRGLAAPNAEQLRVELSAAGAHVEIVAGDVGDRETVRALLDSLPTEAPLSAVFHLAGVLADGLVDDLDPERIERVFRPKVDGALHLDALTRERDLAAFVLFSSASGTLGNAGQSNYAGANACLDALASARRAAGHPAISLAFGPWSVAGMAASLSPAVLAQMRRRGVAPLSMEGGFAQLDAALARPESTIVAIHLELEQLDAPASMLRELAARHIARQAPSTEPTPEPVAARLAALPEDRRHPFILELVRRELAGVLDLDIAHVQPDHEFSRLGLDSLTAIELRNRLVRLTGANVTSTSCFEHPTCQAMAEFIEHDLVRFVTPAANEAPTTALSNDRARVREYIALQRHHQPPARRQGGFRVLELLAELSEARKFDAYASLVTALLAHRRSQDATRPIPPINPVCLAGDPSSPIIYATPSIGLPASPLQFLRIAEHCRDHASLWSSSNPGYDPGTPLPATFGDLLEHHMQAIETIIARTGRTPLLMGYSSGAWFAAPLAAWLERRGTPSPGLILLDSAHPFEWDPSNLIHMFTNNALELHLESSGTDDAFIDEITAMHWTINLVLDEWVDCELTRTPTLHVRCPHGLVFPRWSIDLETDPVRHWGPLIRDLTVVEAQTEHYRLVTEGATECGGLILDWMSRR